MEATISKEINNNDDLKFTLHDHIVRMASLLCGTPVKPLLHDQIFFAKFCIKCVLNEILSEPPNLLGQKAFEHMKFDKKIWS